MIARTWRGTAASREKAEAYRQHFTNNVVPHLDGVRGHRGAYLLQRQADGKIEFLAVTLWDSIDTIRQFAGSNPDVAVVEPEARAALSEFDDRVRHYEIVHRTV